jgi:hypothetical protein
LQISRIVIDGFAAAAGTQASGTVFDRTNPSFGTDGSFKGRDFEIDAASSSLSPQAHGHVPAAGCHIEEAHRPCVAHLFTFPTESANRGPKDASAGAQRQRKVNGHCAGMKQIKRPNVDGATRKIDPGWGRRFNDHFFIIPDS